MILCDLVVVSIHWCGSVKLDSGRRGSLDWKRRYDIISGVARGLLYLHQDSHICIIHRDIKASNILLDDKWIPKIADFGMARLYPEDQTHVNTRVAGTKYVTINLLSLFILIKLYDKHELVVEWHFYFETVGIWLRNMLCMGNYRSRQMFLASVFWFWSLLAVKRIPLLAKIQALKIC